MCELRGSGVIATVEPSRLAEVVGEKFLLARRVTIPHPAPHASRRVESEILGAGRAFIQEKQDHNLPPRMGAYTFSLVDLEDYASGL